MRRKTLDKAVFSATTLKLRHQNAHQYALRFHAVVLQAVKLEMLDHSYNGIVSAV